MTKVDEIMELAIAFANAVHDSGMFGSNDNLEREEQAEMALQTAIESLVKEQSNGKPTKPEGTRLWLLEWAGMLCEENKERNQGCQGNSANPYGSKNGRDDSCQNIETQRPKITFELLLQRVGI